MVLRTATKGEDFGIVAGVLLGAATVVCAVARRAVRVDPAIALRHE